METLHLLSIAIEAAIVLLSVWAVLSKKKTYMAGFAVTFAIYVYYDLATLQNWDTSAAVLYPMFFIATVSALWSIVAVYKKG